MSLAAAEALSSAESSVPRSRRTSSLQLVRESVLAARSMALRDGWCLTLRARRRCASRGEGAGSSSDVPLDGVGVAAGSAPSPVSQAFSHSHTGATSRGVTNKAVCSSPRRAACTAASQGTSLARRLLSKGRCAKCAAVKRWWRSRSPANRCSARAVAARLSAIQSPVGSKTEASAASHRYKSRFSSTASNTLMAGGSASVCASSSGMALRRPEPATF